MSDDFYDFDKEESQTYSGKCNKCGHITLVSTQKDRCPEYYSDIFVKCDCGGSIKFKLPVN